MPIDFHKVSYVYSPKSPFSSVALEGVDFHLEEGHFVALVGRTGSGKSTIAQLLNALLTPSEGAVQVDSFVNAPKTHKKRKAVKALRKHVGLVFQFPEYQLFAETVEKDVAFGPHNFGLSKEKALEKAHEALRLVGLDPSFDKRSPFELSGGEKRKVAIAGILAMEPSYLILDEPTSGLDPKAAEETMALFKEINAKGTSVIFVTHDMDLVLEYADTVLVMADGKLVKMTTPSALFGEDLGTYSLDNPHVFQVAKALKEKGLSIETASLRTVEDLAGAIVEAKKKEGTHE